jgi:hypothetical protein
MVWIKEFLRKISYDRWGVFNKKLIILLCPVKKHKLWFVHRKSFEGEMYVHT